MAMSVTVAACSDDDPKPSSGSNGSSAVAVDKNVTIDASRTYQTIQGFAASDCWMGNWIGSVWTGNRQKMATEMFSQQMDGDGQPLGIGLSMWRVNLGAGSYEQGDKSGIETVNRRAESFLGADGKYDWSKCEGQRYFMEQAKQMGVEKFVLFSNSPLVQYTYNGQGRSDRGGYSNLKSEHYGDFAGYLADVAAHFVGEGYNVTHISPFNEPQYNWEGRDQEGSGWTNFEQAKMVRELDAALTARSLNVDILPGEAASYEYLYKSTGDANRSNILTAYFTPGSQSYIGDLPHVKNIVGAHSYWTDGTWEGMRSVRSTMASAAAARGVEVWQTEWSMLGDGYSTNEFAGFDNCTELDIALYMSKVIHNDLTEGNVTSWSYWTAMDVPHYGHMNRFLLLSLTPAGGEWGDIWAGTGTYYPTSTLWVLGNYSRFIRPGYRRIDLDMYDSRSFFASAYIAPDSKRIVAVYTNLSRKPVVLTETRQGWPGEPTAITTYTTSASKSLKNMTVASGTPVTLDAQAVTTVVYDF